jgi:tape measure domain-containing protein
MEGGAVSMSSIDDRVVNMQFNNAQFQAGITETNASILELKDNLQLQGATDGLDEVQFAADRFSLSNIENALDHIASMFSTFGVIAFTVLQKVTNFAIDAGAKMANAILEPIVQGGAKRALALQQAKFQFRGLGLDVQATMDTALAAVKNTAFGLDDAATAAAQFGASGITAGHGLLEALRGIAGVAAQSGSSFESVAQTFESIAGNGRLMGQDLLSLSSKGINAAATLAKSMGISEAAVRKMVSEGKISFSQFSDAMNAAFGENAKKANETYTGALSNMRAALARIGAEVASPWFFFMRDMFNELTPIIDAVHVALQPLLDDIAAFLGFASGRGKGIINEILGPGIVESISNVVTAIRTIGGVLEKGFRTIFPENTTVQLSNVSKFLTTITEALIPTEYEAGQLQTTFAGLFAIFDIVGRVIYELVRGFAELFGFATEGSGTILDFTSTVGGFIVKIDEAVKTTTFFRDFFQALAGILAGPIAILKVIIGVIGDFVYSLQHMDTGGFDDFADKVKERFKGLATLGEFFDGFWKGIVETAQKAWEFLRPVFELIGSAIGVAVDKIKESLSQLSFQDGAQLLNAGLFGTFILVISKFFDTIKGIISGDGLPLVESIKGVFGSLKDQISAMTKNTNAKTLKEIAIAVALLAASAIALSLVDQGKLTYALGLMAGLIKGLLLAFTAFSNTETPAGIKNLLAMSAALQIMAGAIFTLSLSIVLLAVLPLDRLGQGLAAIILLLYAMVGAFKLLSKSGPELLFAAGAIAIIAPAILLLAGAVAIFAALPLPNLAQGVAAFAAVLIVLTGAMLLLGLAKEEVIVGALAISLVAPAITLLAGAVAIFAALPLPNLIQGVAAFAGVLLILTGAMLLLGLAKEQALIGAAAIVIVAGAMVLIIEAIALLSLVPADKLLAGMLTFAAAVIILVGAVLLLGLAQEASLAGSIALIAIAFAMSMLAPALLLLAQIPWEGVGPALTMLAASIGILAVGGILLIPASVGFMLFGIALLMIGGAIQLVASGLGLLLIGIAALVAIGVSGIAGFALILHTFIAMLPELGTGIGAALVAMAVEIGRQAGTLVGAFVGVLLAMLAAIDTVIPEIIEVAVHLITVLVEALVVLIPLIVEAGLTIIEALLTSIANHIGEIATQAINIVLAFIGALTDKLPMIIAAGGDLILAYINGMGDYIKNNSSKFVTAGSKLFRAIIDGISKAIEQGGKDLQYAGERIGNALIKGARNALGIHSPARAFSDDIMPKVFDGVDSGTDKNLFRAEDNGAAIGAAITDGAVEGVKNAMAGISGAFDTNSIGTPVIRPVIDLTAIEEGANRINGLMPSPTLSINTSSDTATSVALQEQANNARLSLEADPDLKTGTTVNFTQNNNSPKALSTAEVYRQTQNQLSTLKGDLGVVDQSGSA